VLEREAVVNSTLFRQDRAQTVIGEVTNRQSHVDSLASPNSRILIWIRYSITGNIRPMVTLRWPPTSPYRFGPGVTGHTDIGRPVLLIDVQ
jgi:hypothetical protein